MPKFGDPSIIIVPSCSSWSKITFPSKKQVLAKHGLLIPFLVRTLVLLSVTIVVLGRFVTEFNAERTIDTVVWVPIRLYYMSQAISLDTVAAAAYDLVQAFLRPHSLTLFPLCSELLHNTLLRLATILKYYILHERFSITNSTPLSTHLDSIYFLSL